ncbi:uncharacterized protein BX664DRAFT_328143 [Halteromyces radiatus]|uniref:uncharacterized protein n=1 Tax=Halteromyces radiatus TaxID=101107 RepID=UPI00221ED16E|nr:uncharacterized protein BX664DRAFT_328143 [Halteromyces radiatus]KAI8092783.1 hypothetical protein BX664DRAFT_328143 [Halteromyces radiatus]
MLRVYSVMQLEPLWTKPLLSHYYTTIEENPIPADVNQDITETQEREIQEEEEQEQQLATGYLEIEQQQQTQLQEMEQQQPPEEVVILEEEEEEEEEEEKKEEEKPVFSSSPREQSTIHDDHHQEEKQDIRPPSVGINCDLTSITEEQQPVSGSSLISSTGSFPETPTSTTSSSPPRRRIRRDSKFTERRKSMTNKLKRAFSSNSNSQSKRSSIISQ